MSGTLINIIGSGQDGVAGTTKNLTSLNYVKGQLAIIILATMNGGGVTGFTVSDTDTNVYTIRTQFNAATISGSVTYAYCICKNTVAVTPTIARTGLNNITGLNWGAVLVSPNSVEDASVLLGANGSSTTPGVIAGPSTKYGSLVFATVCFVQTGVLASFSNPITSVSWISLFNNAATINQPALLCHVAICNLGGGVGLTYNPGISASRKWATETLGVSPTPNGDMLAMF